MKINNSFRILIKTIFSLLAIPTIIVMLPFSLFIYLKIRMYFSNLKKKVEKIELTSRQFWCRAVKQF